MDYIAIIVIGVLSLANIYLTLQVIKVHGKERRDMLDRLMSKDIKEYKEVTTPIAPSEPVSLTDEEEWAREIEAMRER